MKNFSVREDQTSEYKEEVVRYLLQLESQLPLRGDYLENNTQISPQMRDQLAREIVKVGEEIRVSSQAVQLSILLLDKVLSTVQIKRPVLHVTGMVCFLISVQFHDNNPNALRKVLHQTKGVYTLDDLTKIEYYILKNLSWVLAVPTPAQLVRQLITITGVQFNFAPIFQRCDAFAMWCYRDYGLSSFSPLVIAVVSGVCALEQFKQLRFLSQWVRFLNSKIYLDLPVLDECKRNLLYLLYSQGTVDRENLERLQGSISNLIQDQLVLEECEVYEG